MCSFQTTKINANFAKVLKFVESSNFRTPQNSRNILVVRPILGVPPPYWECLLPIGSASSPEVSFAEKYVFSDLPGNS